ncbi:MAG: hypothetical protein Q8868_10640 [Bacteroidota bacterium]|nr:hypothetical protein [Bacteroidota bacterium]
MKTKLLSAMTAMLILPALFSIDLCSGQNVKSFEKRYMTRLPSGRPADDGVLQKYRMTAVYKNLDIYGNFTGKTKVVGDYTRGYKDGYSQWNNVWVAEAKNEQDPFPQGKKQEFMENFRYLPSSGMMEEEYFKSFPKAIDNIFARNLIWDMLGVEIFAWRYNDSLRFTVPLTSDIKGDFNMADIGKYYHASIDLCWTGISVRNGELCAVIEYRALNNRVQVEVANVKTKGTEQYWGNTWVSLKTRQIEFAEIYSSTFQEIEVAGMKDKFLAKTIRELTVERLK